MWSCDSFGRKRNIQFGSTLAVLGGAFQGGAAALAMFQVGRFVSGLGIGILVTVCPMVSTFGKGIKPEAVADISTHRLM